MSACSRRSDASIKLSESLATLALGSRSVTLTHVPEEEISETTEIVVRMTDEDFDFFATSSPEEFVEEIKKSFDQARENQLVRDWQSFYVSPAIAPEPEPVVKKTLIEKIAGFGNSR